MRSSESVDAVCWQEIHSLGWSLDRKRCNERFEAVCREKIPRSLETTKEIYYTADERPWWVPVAFTSCSTGAL